jgi:MFS family permease
MQSKLKRFLAMLSGPIAPFLVIRLMSGMVLSPRSTFFPIFMEEVGYTAVVIAGLTAVQRFTGLVVALLGGVLSDRITRKRTILLGQIGLVFGCMVFLTPQLALIGVFWVLAGAGMGFATLGGQSYLIDVAPKARLGLLTAFFYWGVTIGGAVANPPAGVLLQNWTYEGFGLVMTGAAVVLVAVTVLFLPPSGVEPERKGVSWRGFFGYGELVSRRAMRMLAALRFLPTYYYGMGSIFVPLMLNAAGASKVTIALYAGIMMVASSLSQAAVGRWADAGGRRTPTLVSHSVLVLCIFGIAAFPGNVATLFVFGSLGNAAAWALSTLFPSLVAEVTSPQERGRALGFVHLFWNAAMILGPAIGGFLYERWISLPFLVSGGLNILAVAVARWHFATLPPPAADAATSPTPD